MTIRSILKIIYRHFIGVLTVAFNRVKNKNKKLIGVYYGGACAGSKGGPQVKVSLLHEYFPENKNFNILYLLSGALYMPTWAIKNVKNSGMPIVLNQNGVFYPAWSPDIWEYENERMAEALTLSSHVFYQSEFCKECANKFLGVNAKSYDILYNAVDTKRFLPKQKELKTHKIFTFLITGNIVSSTSYRIFSAIDAIYFARKQGLNIRIIFYGIFPKDILEVVLKTIQNYNLEEFFILNGPYSKVQAPEIFANADAYIMTKHNDPCPNVVLEAMSCGLPILHVSSGGTPELVDKTAGFCVDVEKTYDHNPLPNVQDMVEGMSYIMSNVENLSKAARLRAVQKFDIQFWVNSHKSIFEKLLQERL